MSSPPRSAANTRNTRSWSRKSAPRSTEGERMRYRYWTFVLLALCGSASAQTAAKAESRNMELVGYNDLQGRSAYQPLVHRQGDRWIAYIGHHGDAVANPLTGQREPNGTSILDVTNPKQPKYLAHIPGEPGLA